MTRAEYLAEAYFARKMPHTRSSLETLIRDARRDGLANLLAWCHHHPDAPANAIIRKIHENINEGML